jgi:putative restriction endonuclease
VRKQQRLHFGHIPGIPVGAVFASRLALLEAGVHRQLQAGISGRIAEGADAILVNPAYEDNQDLGPTIFYAGEGGRSRQTGRQVADQQLAGRNKALWISYKLDLPVRVVRQIQTPAGPQYRYDGLYKIVDCQRTTGLSGYQILLFEFKFFIQPE